MAENKWTDFFAPFFPSRDDAQSFVERCQAAKPKISKIIIYQTQRLVSLADEMPKLRPGRESLQILFLLICAESVAKLAAGYTKEGMSRHYVQEFFRQYASQEDIALIRTGFTTHMHGLLGLEGAINALHDVRCDVVHEGKYWAFTFRMGDVGMLNLDPDVISQITLGQFRDAVVRTAIRAASACLTTAAA